jgi:hypothetical protein
MKWISPLFSDARNKIGGTIYARNRAGVYQRARVTPTNPQTPFQQANRAMFKTIVATWRTLTPAQRLSWNNMALTRTLTDSLGQTSMPSGFQLYTSNNRNRLLCGLSQLATAPTPPADAWTVTPFVDALEETSGILTALGLQSSNDSGDDELTFIFAATPALSPGIKFVAPWLYRTLLVDTANDNPWDLTAAWVSQFGGAYLNGQQIGIRSRSIDTATGYLVAEQYTIAAGPI